ncbi:MAG: NAD-dependent epimerase/dehydratase family protein [Oscillospiraceae bacterium]|nr:NAD-dependent epimerase/dehydratase family protein [Oscillospiraceae bacterium]
MEKGLSVLTGATGHVGYAVLKELLAREEKTRILIRKDVAIFKGMDCEKAFGDVTDLPSLVAAFEGAETVYHFAGVIEVNAGNEDLLWNVNVQGTKNVVEACRVQGVKRLVYASSVDVYPPLPNNQVMTELDRFSPDILEGLYAKTKATATQYVLDASKKGEVDAVVVHPSACIGPYDFKVSSVGDMVRMYLAGKFPVSMKFGAYNFVDVRDVATGTYFAAKQGRRGECYILCGETVSVEQFIAMLAATQGKQPPRLRLSHGFVSAIAPLMELYYKAAKKTPLLTRYSVRKLVSNCNFSYEKAAKELGYAPMPTQQSISDMVAWILEHEGKKQ